MALFKRFEFWIALVFLAVIALWALISSRCSPAQEPKEPSSKVEPAKKKAADVKADDTSSTTKGVEETTKPKPASEPTTGTAPEKGARVSLKKLVLVRDYENAELRITAEIENVWKQPTPLQAPLVTLVDGAGNEVPHFVLAFQKTEVLDQPGERRVVTLPFWLDPIHLKGSLELRVGEEKIPIKSDNKFSFGKIENEIETPITGLDWKPAASR